MKYCYQCGRISEGDPPYCRTCGRSYDVRLCSRLHANSRDAEFCAQCGSRDLSTCQPKIPLGWQLLALLARLGLWLLFVYTSLSVLIALLRTPEVQQLLVYIGIVLGGAYCLYTKLPTWLQALLRSLWKRKTGVGDE